MFPASFLFPTALGSRYYYHSHFTDEETEKKVTQLVLRRWKSSFELSKRETSIKIHKVEFKLQLSQFLVV